MLFFQTNSCGKSLGFANGMSLILKDCIFLQKPMSNLIIEIKMEELREVGYVLEEKAAIYGYVLEKY